MDIRKVNTSIKTMKGLTMFKKIIHHSSTVFVSAIIVIDYLMNITNRSV